MYQTTVAIEDMHFYAFHGFYPEERKMGNDYMLTVSCDLPVVDINGIADTVNYEELYQICKAQMSQAQMLLETVASRILDAIKGRWPNVVSAKVVLRKSSPQLGGKLKCSTVTLKF